MSDKFSMRVGEALVAGGPGNAAEPVVIGELDGPFGTLFLSYGNRSKVILRS